MDRFGYTARHGSLLHLAEGQYEGPAHLNAQAPRGDFEDVGWQNLIRNTYLYINKPFSFGLMAL
jgi:hypothetical protein